MGAVECASGPGRGFTMVELMVVIAIMGVLVALLVGGIGPAIGMAENVECQNNLTNIAKAVISYTTDYKGPSRRRCTRGVRGCSGAISSCGAAT
jgi:prepilin-type N-terminal cleavage/methylation domain-containing protein